MKRACLRSRGAKIVTPQPAPPTSSDLAASIATMTARLRALSTAVRASAVRSKLLS